MTRWSVPALVGCLLVASCGSDDEPRVEPGPIEAKVMSFNVLCSFCDDSYGLWDDRVPYITDIISRHSPDLIGLQELLHDEEVNQVLAGTSGYSALYLVDPEGPIFKEYADATILYRPDRFDVVQNGYYFLSDTPDEYWSTGWASAQLWRLVAWAHLRQRSDGRELYFATSHVDNNSPNQEMSAPLILSRTEPFAARMPALVVGDFNSKPDSKAYSILTSGAFAFENTFDRADSWDSVHNQGAKPDFDPASRIDHIFVASPQDWACEQWLVDQHVYGPSKGYPSDHYPIVATVTFP